MRYCEKITKKCEKTRKRSFFILVSVKDVVARPKMKTVYVA